jgi:Ribose 5-phosphate isomerase RpiB
LLESGYEVKDFGTYGTESVDYPDMIHPLAKAIETGEYPLGIIFMWQWQRSPDDCQQASSCEGGFMLERGVGQAGSSAQRCQHTVVAGAFHSVRPGLAYGSAFLTTPFEGGRHTRRVEKIERLD